MFEIVSEENVIEENVRFPILHTGLKYTCYVIYTLRSEILKKKKRQDKVGFEYWYISIFLDIIVVLFC